MRASAETVEKIKAHEECKLKAYKCPGGVWTIGYGHTGGVTEGMVITQERAEELFLQDVGEVERQVEPLGEWTQNQFDALVSFVYNVGIGNFVKSTLYKKIKANAPKEEIKYQFGRWIYSGGKIMPGLQIRRSWEAARYFS